MNCGEDNNQMHTLPHAIMTIFSLIRLAYFLLELIKEQEVAQFPFYITIETRQKPSSFYLCDFTSKA